MKSNKPDSQSVSISASAAVILVNWNNWRDTVECIDSLLAQSHRNFHIFVVDNDSRDGSLEHIRAWCAKPSADAAWRHFEGVDRHTARCRAEAALSRVTDRSDRPLPPAPEGCRITLIRSGGNLGFAGGCNVGMRAAGLSAFDFFWMLNTDTVVHRDALHALLRRALQDTKIGMVGSTVRYYDVPEKVQALGGAHMNPLHGVSRHLGQGLPLDQIGLETSDVERRMSYVFGASMFVSGAYIREVGLMQEDYFLYFEEIDWALRGRGRFTLGYAADSHVFHKSGASSSKLMPLFTAGFYYRNRIRFMSRYFPRALAATKRRLMIDVLYYIAKRRWSHVRLVASVLWNARSIAEQARRDVGTAPLK
jgi:GT2 family glycosyltransferase